MTKRRDRAFAWVGIIIFGVSALALSATVIIQQLISSSSSPQTAQSCTDTSVEAVLPAPTPYIPPSPVTTLQVTDLTPGTGQAAQSGDCLIVKYYGTLASNGTAFSGGQNFTQPTGFAFNLTQGQVIQGWVEGLVGMKVGGTRRLVIPPSLAYGSTAQNGIPANSTLVFVVKLLRIQS